MSDLSKVKRFFDSLKDFNMSPDARYDLYLEMKQVIEYNSQYRENKYLTFDEFDRVVRDSSYPVEIINHLFEERPNLMNKGLCKEYITREFLLEVNSNFIEYFITNHSKLYVERCSLVSVKQTFKKALTEKDKEIEELKKQKKKIKKQLLKLPDGNKLVKKLFRKKKEKIKKEYLFSNNKNFSKKGRIEFRIKCGTASKEELEEYYNNYPEDFKKKFGKQYEIVED